ncbi:MAG TPA: hypothetical protein VF194_08195 [Ferrovibrio sp.]|uniref:hypothetical protein n=1 Tax=Ferrovibrio sp. TaxID=1917215 RepID=UPI002ED29DE8
MQMTVLLLTLLFPNWAQQSAPHALQACTERATILASRMEDSAAKAAELQRACRALLAEKRQKS